MNENEEPESVPLSNAIADPRAVVVMGRHADLTGLAVFAPQWLLDVAYRAVLILDEENHVLLIRCLFLEVHLDLWFCV